jgi:2-polyprenyl-6-methoxyphenol hydroxylase-like FAD-dependent oxidoreductase
MTRPITIIGGGLSGLALGCCLQKNGVSVTIIEQGKYPRHKVCGEFICGVSDETLDGLGILELFENAESVRNIKWHIADEQVLDKKLPHHGTGLSRYLLDDQLQQLFRNLGGTILKERVDKSEYLDGQAEGIVWACGKEKQGKGNDAQRWLGMKMHVTEMDIDGLEMHTGGNSVKGGYVGLSPVEDGRINLCGLFEVNKNVTGKGADKFHGYLMSMGLEKLANRLAAATIDQDSFSAVAGFSLGHQKILTDDQQRVLPIGDAAVLIPPFTGNGMSIALESAYLAGQCLLPYCRNEKNSDWDDMLKTYLYLMRKKFRKRLIAARFIHPFFFHPLGKWSLSTLAKCKLIPFRGLFYLLR